MFERITLEAARIVSWLRQYGDSDGRGNDSLCRYVSLKDESGKILFAELHDWGNGRERLVVVYWVEQNGQQVPAPKITLELRDGKVVSGVIDTRLTSRRLGVDDGPDGVALTEKFLWWVWDRHLSNWKGASHPKWFALMTVCSRHWKDGSLSTQYAIQRLDTEEVEFLERKGLWPVELSRRPSWGWRPALLGPYRTRDEARLACGYRPARRVADAGTDSNVATSTAAVIGGI